MSKLTTIVVVASIFGFILLTAVVFIVNGLILKPVAVFKFIHDVEATELPSRVHVKGVIKLGNIGKTIIIYDVAIIGLLNSKLNMILAGVN